MTTLKCLGCGEPAPGGMQICGQYLCPGCEEKMVCSEAGKKDYQHWMDSCRRFWENLQINLTDLEN
jgi:hypothetical protein